MGTNFIEEVFSNHRHLRNTSPSTRFPLRTKGEHTAPRSLRCYFASGKRCQTSAAPTGAERGAARSAPSWRQVLRRFKIGWTALNHAFLRGSHKEHIWTSHQKEFLLRRSSGDAWLVWRISCFWVCVCVRLTSSCTNPRNCREKKTERYPETLISKKWLFWKGNCCKRNWHLKGNLLFTRVSRSVPGKLKFDGKQVEKFPAQF